MKKLEIEQAAKVAFPPDTKLEVEIIGNVAAIVKARWLVLDLPAFLSMVNGEVYETKRHIVDSYSGGHKCQEYTESITVVLKNQCLIRLQRDRKL